MVVGHPGLMGHAPSLVVEKVYGRTQGHVTIPHLRMVAKTAMDQQTELYHASPAHVSIHIQSCNVCTYVIIITYYLFALIVCYRVNKLAVLYQIFMPTS